MKINKFLVWFLLLTLETQAQSDSILHNNYYIIFNCEDDSKGEYVLRDSLNHKDFEISHFDNTLNPYKDSLINFVSKGNRFISDNDCLYWRLNTWKIGTVTINYASGAKETLRYIIIENNKNQGKYKNIPIGFERMYLGNILLHEAYYTELGKFGLETSYYDNGRLKLQHTLNYDEKLGYCVVDGPSMMYYTNGKLKRIEIFESGSVIMGVDYNKLGLKKWNRRNRFYKRNYREYLQTHKFPEVDFEFIK